MPDKDKDLKLLCAQVADDFLKNQDIDDENGIGDQGEGGEKKGNNQISKRSQDTLRFLISSKPYVRKTNNTSDRALNFCWEIHLRFDEYDLYVSILRRSYIPPITDMY